MASAPTNPLYEEAKKCPICGIPGEYKSASRQQRPTGRGRRGGCKVEVYACVNERCRWHNTTWIVQLNDDGTIPERKATKDPNEKEFPMPERMNQMGAAYLDRLQLETETGQSGPI